MPAVGLHKCCICIPMRIGCLISSYLLTAYKTVVIVFSVIHLAILNTVSSQHPEAVTSSMTFMKLLLYASTFINTLEMVMSVSLLVGLHKNKLENIRKFFTIYPFMMIMYVILYTIVLAVFGKEYTAFEWYMSIPDVIILLFEIYTVVMVKRCYLQMKAANRDAGGIVYGPTDGI